MRHNIGPHTDHRGRRSARPGAFAIVVLAVGVAIAGCSSSAKAPASGGTAVADASGTPRAGGTAVPQPTGTAATATSPVAGGPSPVGTSPVQLVANTGPNNLYTISVPSTWEIEEVSPTARRYVMFVSGSRVAQFTVNCVRGSTIDDLQKTDAGLVGRIGGQYAVDGVKDVTVAGLAGKETMYTAPLSSSGASGGPIQQTRVLYLQGTTCAWQLLMQTYGNGLLAKYTPLFTAILATWKPAAPAG